MGHSYGRRPTGCGLFSVLGFRRLCKVYPWYTDDAWLGYSDSFERLGFETDTSGILTARVVKRTELSQV